MRQNALKFGKFYSFFPRKKGKKQKGDQDRRFRSKWEKTRWKRKKCIKKRRDEVKEEWKKWFMYERCLFLLPEWAWNRRVPRHPELARTGSHSQTGLDQRSCGRRGWLKLMMLLLLWRYNDACVLSHVTVPSDHGFEGGSWEKRSDIEIHPHFSKFDKIKYSEYSKL